MMTREENRFGFKVAFQAGVMDADKQQLSMESTALKFQTFL